MATKEAELEAKLAETQARIAAEEKKVDLLKKEVADKEGKVGMTVEEQDRLAELDRIIAEEQAEINKWQAEVDRLNVEVPLWKKRLDSAKALLTAYQNYRKASPKARVDVPDNIKSAYKSAWGTEAVKIVSLAPPPNIYANTAGGKPRSIIDEYKERFKSYATDRLKAIATHSRWGGYDYTTGWGNFRPAVDMAAKELLWERGIRYPDWLNVITTVETYISKLSSQVTLAESKYHDLYTQLQDAKYELEQARRRLLDAQSSKSRAELEIRRAIALRQAELDAAKARLEMEIRLLNQLKASEEMLRAQIEQARAEAVARAAREREALLKAQEEEKRRIAEEQRRKAEEELAVAQAESMTAIAEREEARKQAYIEAAKAREEAEEIAKQREEQAKLAAQAEAAASVARLQAEEASRKVAVAKTMPPVAAEVKPVIPTVALIALVGLGIFALTRGEEKKPTTPRGKYIAEKMKK